MNDGKNNGKRSIREILGSRGVKTNGLGGLGREGKNKKGIIDERGNGRGEEKEEGNNKVDGVE
ncbi:hypothetical protein, partial [Staphylococcus epidermidis]|uniref:hypothetical protein n=1 Tax=Staphylococcus epidermidis TaxID=1282 RepID=UPI001C92D40E